MSLWSKLAGTMASAFGIGPKATRGTIDAGSLTAARTFDLPDKDGTLATVADVATPGSVDVDFGQTGLETVVASVADATVTGGTVVTGTAVVAGAGRDADEIECEAFQVSPVVTAGVGIDFYVQNLTGGAEGVYTVNYLRVG